MPVYNLLQRINHIRNKVKTWCSLVFSIRRVVGLRLDPADTSSSSSLSGKANKTREIGANTDEWRPVLPSCVKCLKATVEYNLLDAAGSIVAFQSFWLVVLLKPWDTSEGIHSVIPSNCNMSLLIYNIFFPTRCISRENRDWPIRSTQGSKEVLGKTKSCKYLRRLVDAWQECQFCKTTCMSIRRISRGNWDLRVTIGFSLFTYLARKWRGFLFVLLLTIHKEKLNNTKAKPNYNRYILRSKILFFCSENIV